MMDNTDRISSLEFFFLTVCFSLSHVRVLSFTDSTAKQDSWLVLIAAFIVSIPFVLIYTELAKRFPSKSLLEIYTTVFGKILGTCLSIIYIAYFLIVFSHYLNDLSEFYTGFIEPETPAILFILIAVLVSAYGLKTGIHYLAKMSAVIAVISFLSIIIPFLMLLGKMDFSNFLPILRHPPKIYAQSISQAVLVPCCQVLYLFMLTPKLQSANKLGKYTLGGLAVGILGLLLVSIRNTAVLGPMAAVVDSASYASTRIIEIGNFFTRVEIVVALITTILIFFDICVIYFDAAQGIRQIFKLKSLRWAIIPAGMIAVVLAIVVFPSSIEHLEFAKMYNVPVYSAFHLFFPPLALIIAKLRKLKAPQDDTS